MSALKTQLSLHDFKTMVRLGCTEAERAMPQEVRFSLDIQFAQPPQGCLSDDLQETLCYAKISQLIREVAENSEYQLVEKLGQRVFAQLSTVVPPETHLHLEIHKVRPPVADLDGGVRFSLNGLAIRKN